MKWLIIVKHPLDDHLHPTGRITQRMLLLRIKLCESITQISLDRSPNIRPPLILHTIQCSIFAQKNIEVDWHFIKHKLETKIIVFSFVKTKDRLTNVLTKTVPNRVFYYLFAKLGMRERSIGTLGPEVDVAPLILKNYFEVLYKT